MLIALATDFGSTGPYMGQMRAVLAQQAPEAVVVDLFTDLPRFQPKPSAYVLAAHLGVLPRPAIVVGVVDPGVGTDRAGILVQVDGLWLVGPDNGLFAPLVRRAREVRAWRLPDPPATASACFHGRDIFAPAAADLARGHLPEGIVSLVPESLDRVEWPDDLAEVVYMDGYGNAMTGLRAAALPEGAVIRAAGRLLPRLRTFGEAPVGSAFHHVNSNGLIEVAVNQGRADESLGLKPGSPIDVTGV
ncbi:S-adenosyl-l-methionine hydroxide adenosyltransferase family protein [Rhodospirillum sp. A1_3_36]|uniref:SAM hydrolase/SAM-dependent halogenase family protein n=1 Tax=Rhodospirillum sp. A1_3_36 TaxID=3391666 RepID=UPI0039A56837